MHVIAVEVQYPMDKLYAQCVMVILITEAMVIIDRKWSVNKKKQNKSKNNRRNQTNNGAAGASRTGWKQNIALCDRHPVSPLKERVKWIIFTK